MADSSEMMPASLDLRDSIAAALWHDAGENEVGWALYFPEANAVLAMPEMQAIRTALRLATYELGLPINVHLPPSVSSWVLS